MTQINTSHFELNRANLDSAAMQQASLYDYYGHEMNLAKDKLSRLENRMELLQADVRTYEKENWKGAKAPTIDDLKCAVIKNPKVMELQQEIFEAELEVNELSTAVKAMEHKRDMIGVMAKFVLSASYNATDTISPEDHVNLAANNAVRGKSL